MPIQGPLRELGIHDVFQLLDLGRKTGVLRIVSELRQNEGRIWFESGAVVAAAIRSNPNPLGEQLRRAGKIREEDLAHAQGLQSGGDTRRIGEILVANGAITQRDLEVQVRAQLEEVVFILLGWSEGYFSFEEGPAATIPREAAIRLPTESLLLEAARRIDEWSRIQTKIPHLGIVPRLAAPVSEEPGSLVLIPFEWRVLTAIDGMRDIREIALVVGDSEFTTARTLFGLASANVIVLDDPVAASLAALPSGDSDALLSQALGHLRMGDIAAARTVAEAAIVAGPESAQARCILGQTWLREERYAEAEEAFRVAGRLDSEDAEALRLHALSLAALGRFDAAVRAWVGWMTLPYRPPSEEQFEADIEQAIDAGRTLAAMLRGRRE